MGFQVYSGINGCVGQSADGSSLSNTPSAAISAIGKWDANDKSEASEFASSATSQAMDRVVGNDDWDGNYGAYGDMPAFYPGDFFMMYGFLTAIPGGVSKYLSGRAIADEFSIKLEIEGAKEIEHSVKMSCAYNGIPNGQFQPANPGVPTPQPYYDQSIGNTASAAGCVVAVAVPAAVGNQKWYILKDARTADLTLKTANKNYHSSATAYFDISVATPGTVGVWRNWCGRTRGNLDATASVSQYVLPEEMIPNKTILGLRIYTQPFPQSFIQALPMVSGYQGYLQLDGTINASPPGIAVTGYLGTGKDIVYRNWEINWILFNAHSGIGVDRKSAAIIGGSTNGGLKSVANLVSAGGTGVVPYGTVGFSAIFGCIIPPGGYGSSGTPWWPWGLPKL